MSLSDDELPALPEGLAKFKRGLHVTAELGNPEDPGNPPVEPEGEVDPSQPAQFHWQKWDTGYRTGEVRYTAKQLGFPENTPVKTLAISAKEDGTFVVTATEIINLLDFHGDMAAVDWENWLTVHERQLRDFFKDRYDAVLDVKGTPGRDADWANVGVATSVTIKRATITPSDAYVATVRETRIHHVYDDSHATGGLGRQLRAHVESKIVIESERALSVLPEVADAADRDASARATYRHVDEEIRVRGTRTIDDRTAVSLARTVDERLCPDISRFGAIGMGDRDALLEQATRAAAFTRDAKQLARLHALLLYFIHGPNRA